MNKKRIFYEAWQNLRIVILIRASSYWMKGTQGLLSSTTNYQMKQVRTCHSPKSPTTLKDLWRWGAFKKCRLYLKIH